MLYDNYSFGHAIKVFVIFKDYYSLMCTVLWKAQCDREARPQFKAGRKIVPIELCPLPWRCILNCLMEDNVREKKKQNHSCTRSFVGLSWKVCTARMLIACQQQYTFYLIMYFEIKWYRILLASQILAFPWHCTAASASQLSFEHLEFFFWLLMLIFIFIKVRKKIKCKWKWS